MKLKKVLLVVGGVAVVGVAAFMIKGYFDAKAVPTGTMVMTESIKKDTITTTVSAKGEVSLLNTELIYSNTLAEVEKVMVEKNDMVKKGDVLIRYTEKSRENLEHKIRDAELALRTAQLLLNQARIPASETTIDSQNLEISNTKQEITNMEMAIGTLKTDIANANIKIADAEKAYNDSKALFDLGAVSKTELDAQEKLVKEAKDALVVLQNKLTQNESSLTSLKDSLTYKQKVLNETQNKTSTQESKNIIAQRQISVEQANIVIADLKKELADFQQEIISPIDGTVTMLSISKGEIALTEKALMEIANVEDYIIKVDVNERNAAKIEIGQEVQLKGSVLGKEVLTGKVSKIGYIAEQKQTTSGTERVVPVEITVDESKSSEILKPGYSLEAVITTEIKEDIIVVPILATLKDKDGNSYVFVVKEDSTLEKRMIELGVYADMTVEVSNLSEGENVVSQPTIDMTEGMAVTVMPTMVEGQVEAEGDAK